MEHSRGPGLGRLDAVLDEIGVLAAAAGGSASGLLGVVAEIAGLCDRLEAVRVDLLREAQWVSEPGLSVAERLHATNRVSLSSARSDSRLARDLADRFSVVACAWREGRVSSQQARQIVAGLKRLPHTLSIPQLEACQLDVVAFADRLDPDELRRVAERMAEVIDPDHAEAREADRVERDARLAHARRSLVVVPDHHGSMLIRGQVPIADGELFLSQLNALMPSAASYALTHEVPELPARRADALMRWCGIKARSEQLPSVGGDRPHVRITLNWNTLITGLGTAALACSGEPICAGEARRLSCDARLIPAVLGAPSELLDVGRSHRFFPRGLRTALELRDQGCTFPGCNAPPTACEAHHIHPWWDGGTTSLENGVLLCAYHHRLVEPDPSKSTKVQWQVAIDPTSGMPWFTPPSQIDPERVPRLHHRFVLNGSSPPTRAAAQVAVCAVPDGLQSSPAWQS